MGFYISDSHNLYYGTKYHGLGAGAVFAISYGFYLRLALWDAA